MLKIDSHQHFWELGRCDYPWLTPELAPIYRDFRPDDLKPNLDEVGVAGTVIVQATHDRAETEWYLSLTHQYDFLKGVVGWVDLTAYDVDEQLNVLKEQGPLCGIRHQVHDEVDPRWLLQGKVLRGLRLLARQELAYDLLLRPVHLPHLPELFGEVPGMRWVIDHIAKPEIKAGKLQPWRDDMQRVARYPNVYCKVSGMITEADHRHWTVEDIRPYFEAVLEMFGPNRLLFGSDWPVCTLAGSYKQVHDLLSALISGLSETEQEAIWSKTALEVYKLQL